MCWIGWGCCRDQNLWISDDNFRNECAWIGIGLCQISSPLRDFSARKNRGERAGGEAIKRAGNGAAVESVCLMTPEVKFTIRSQPQKLLSLPQRIQQCKKDYRLEFRISQSWLMEDTSMWTRLNTTIAWSRKEPDVRRRWAFVSPAYLPSNITPFIISNLIKQM